MSTYWLAIIGISILGAILSPLLLLPDVSLPPFINQGITGVIQALSAMHSIIPLTTDMLLAVVGALALTTAAIWVYKGVKWVYTKIPGVS